jgi:hypothetical protein
MRASDSGLPPNIRPRRVVTRQRSYELPGHKLLKRFVKLRAQPLALHDDLVISFVPRINPPRIIWQARRGMRVARIQTLTVSEHFPAQTQTPGGTRSAAHVRNDRTSRRLSSSDSYSIVVE